MERIGMHKMQAAMIANMKASMSNMLDDNIPKMVASSMSNMPDLFNGRLAAVTGPTKDFKNDAETTELHERVDQIDKEGSQELRGQVKNMGIHTEQRERQEARMEERTINMEQ